MAEVSTWVKLDRNILQWRWFRNANTLQMFLFLILKANTVDKDFENITVHRGQLVTSYPHLARDLGMSVKSARTALGHLKQTGEVAVKSYPKYSLITVLNYERYQKKGQGSGQSKGSQRAGNGQQYKNKEEYKEYTPAPPVEYHDDFLEDWS